MIEHVILAALIGLPVAVFAGLIFLTLWEVTKQ